MRSRRIVSQRVFGVVRVGSKDTHVCNDWTQLGTSFTQEFGFLEVVVEMNGSCCSMGDYPGHLAEEYNQALQTFTRTIPVIANFFG